ncbi:MAG: CoA synthetase [Geminicoccaceae bacterium]|nr:MAG: CoA synthetase [Geminicoccaceae bacterium]
MTTGSSDAWLITLLARLIGSARHVAVGAASPLPAAAALMAKVRHGTRVTLLHSRRYNPFTDGSRELFDLAGQGRIDVFFLGGVQIDGQANVNLVGTGTYPRLDKRFPGCFGAAYLAYVVPRVILFREEHSPRTLVERVDFISAPGTSPPGVFRPGGPSHLLTSLALFAFDRAIGRFRLEARQPDTPIETIQRATGFAFDQVPSVPPWPGPTTDDLALLRGPVATALAESYPEFARRLAAHLA